MSRSFLAYFAPTEHRRVNEFVGLLLAAMAILVGLSLISFNPTDPSFNISRSIQFEGKPANFIGVVGSYLADGFFQLFGYSSFLLPIFLGVYAFYWLASWPVKNLAIRFCGMLFLTVTIATTLGMSALSLQDSILPGGLIGKIL